MPPLIFSNAEPEGKDDATPLHSTDSADQVNPTAAPDTTKRDYALLELLDSERTYASDLILIRDHQIPLASGRLSSISSLWPISNSELTIRRYPGLDPATSSIPAIPQGSSVVPSRPLTTASEASALSLNSIFTLRPMKTKDINIVFGNIAELAAFSEEFLDHLESALGELIEGNEGEDYVGRFFLDFIPQMEPLYRTYILNHSHALEHYHHLSQTFQFDVYFPRSQILAHKASNAWDLPSLLIKPVQRLLHYPQLLAAIIAETPDSHGDKADLVEAHAQIEELARRLNARWMQQRVVQEVLACAGTIDASRAGGDAAKARKKGSRDLGLVASVSRGRVINPWSVTVKAKEGPGAGAEAQAQAVKAMGERLKSYEPFMRRFAREAVNLAGQTRNVVGALNRWAQSFGKVIWMDPKEGRSEAFEAFLALTGDQLLAACRELRAEIREDLMRTINSLQGTMVAPMHLLETMQTLEPMHHNPPKLDLAASKSYVALRAQLFAELPTYLTLLDRSMAACIVKLAHLQRRFYSNIHDRWAELRDRVEMDRYANQSAEEILRHRYREVKARVASLIITRRPGERLVAAKQRTEFGERYAAGGQGISISDWLASMPPSSSFGNPFLPDPPALEPSRVQGPPRALRPPLRPYLGPGLFARKKHRRFGGRMESDDSSTSSSETGPGWPSSSTEHSTVMVPPVSPYIITSLAMPTPPRIPPPLPDWITPSRSNLDVNSVSGNIPGDGRTRPLRMPSSRQWRTDPFVRLGSSNKSWGNTHVIQSPEGVAYMPASSLKGVKSRKQPKLEGVRPRIIPLPTVEEVEEDIVSTGIRIRKVVSKTPVMSRVVIPNPQTPLVGYCTGMQVLTTNTSIP